MADPIEVISPKMVHCTMSLLTILNFETFFLNMYNRKEIDAKNVLLVLTIIESDQLKSVSLGNVEY